jgi:predicted dehydrogenase
MKPIQYAIIGAGNFFWGRHHKNLQKIPDCRCVVVCDPSPESRRRAEEELGAKAFATTGEWLEAGDSVDAILNFSPPFARKEAIEVASRLQVPVFTEKPPATSSAEGREILEFLEKATVPVCVGFMFRYMPAVDRVRELLDGQRVIHVNSEYFCPALTKWKLADWFRLKEKSGGPVIDQAIHLFDLVRYLAGEITEVMAFETNVVRPKDDACTIEDSSSTILRFESGATGAHLQSWVHDVEEGLVTVRTERDRLTLDTTGNLTGRVDGKPVSFEAPAALAEKNFHHLEMETFMEAVRTGDFSRIRSPYADALRSLQVSEAVNRSMATNQTVNVELS